MAAPSLWEWRSPLCRSVGHFLEIPSTAGKTSRSPSSFSSAAKCHFWFLRPSLTSSLGSAAVAPPGSEIGQLITFARLPIHCQIATLPIDPPPLHLVGNQTECCCCWWKSCCQIFDQIFGLACTAANLLWNNKTNQISSGGFWRWTPIFFRDNRKSRPSYKMSQQDYIYLWFHTVCIQTPRFQSFD